MPKTAQTTAKTNPTIIVRDKWHNAVAMAAHSLVNEGDISPKVPKNFTNCKNAAPRGIQNYDCNLVQFLEGYETNLWATPKQIAEIGGVFDEDCPKVTISIEKTSRRTGNPYCTNYKLVNLDEVSFPNGIEQDHYDQIVAAAAIDEEYEVPAPDSFEPTPLPSKKAPAKKAPAKKVAVKKAPATAPRNTLPLSVPTPAPKAPRETNVPSIRHSADFIPEGKQPNTVIEFTFDGQPFHVEGRTADEAKMLLEFTLSAYVKAAKALA